MLLELRGQNFGCFRDEFRLSMLATDVDPGSDRGIIKARIEGDDEPLRLLRAVAIYGPNASGKSTVIRAAGSFGQLMSRQLRSDSPIHPYDPFAFGSSRGGVVRLGVKAVVDHRVYDYAIAFDRTRFIAERLEWLNSDGQSVVLFDRQEQDVTGTWKANEQFSLLAKDFRSNALLLPLADRLAPGLAENIAVGIRRLLMSFHPVPEDMTPPWSSRHSATARRAKDEPAFGAWLLSHLQSADLGIVDLRTEEEQVLFRDDTSETDTLHRLVLFHRGTGYATPIAYARESQGTRRLVQVAPVLFDLTHATRPHAVYVDELDESLHPTLLEGLVRHFNCETPAEKIGGQLIFVTHDTGLLDAEAKNAVLRRDQVYFTEKDAEGGARLYSLAEFKERNNLNLRRRYLQGRYGAIPSLDTLAE